MAKVKAIGETRRLITLVAEATSGAALGCHIVGPDVGNLIHEAVIAMAGDIPYREIGRAIHVHRALAEGVDAAAGGVHRPATA